MIVRAFDPLRALRTLQKHDVAFVVIGGFAARIWGSPTVTNDLDLCYARARTNLAALVRALRELEASLRGAGDDLPFILDEKSIALGDSFTFSTLAGNLDCFGTPAGTTGYDDLKKGATEIDLEDGLLVAFASIDDVLRMKRAAGRPKDLIEVEILEAVKKERDRA
jgi:hypothetical protein